MYNLTAVLATLLLCDCRICAFVALFGVSGSSATSMDTYKPLCRCMLWLKCSICVHGCAQDPNNLPDVVLFDT